MLRKYLIALLLLPLAALWAQPSSIEKKSIRLPFSHRGVARAVAYTVTHPDVPPAFDGFRLAFVSDIHYVSKFKQKHIASLCRMLRYLQPDALLLGGDYQEGCQYVEELTDSLAAVAPPHGIAAVLGNNDYERCTDLIRSAFRSRGICLLEDSCFTIARSGDSLRIVGIRDPFHRPRPDRSPVQECDSSDFVILLTHTPDYAQDTDNSRADLALAGHTHGGQVAFFGYAPQTGSHYGQRFVRGLNYTDGGLPVITTNGIGTSRRNIRLGARSEVLIIELHSTHPLAVSDTGAAATASTGLPLVEITTPGGTPVASREEWQEQARLRITLPDGTTAYDSPQTAIRLRGHSTASKPKKPYALKLESKASLLGMAPHKRWVLLANFMDHSLMRNNLAFAIAREAKGLAWTPQGKWVDLSVNGQKQGCYWLGDQVRVEKGRVDIDEKEGYLLEIDSYFDEPCRFRTACKQLPVNIKAPDEPSAEALSYIEQWLNDIERILYVEKRDNLDTLYRHYIDINSFADWWLVHELTQNAEPNGPRSCYFYKDKDSLLKAGPVWDFDLAFIDVGLDRGGDLRPARLKRADAVLLTGDSLYNRRALWYDRLLSDPHFRSCVKQRWNEMKPRLHELAGEIDRWQAEIAQSAAADEQLWQGKDPARFDNTPNFQASVARLKQVYLYRLDRLDQIVNDFD